VMMVYRPWPRTDCTINTFSCPDIVLMQSPTETSEAYLRTSTDACRKNVAHGQLQVAASFRGGIYESCFVLVSTVGNKYHFGELSLTLSVSSQNTVAHKDGGDGS
jgi:hypothetical protein